MRFDWDDGKAESNLCKHGIDFDTASLAFDDPLHLLIPDRVIDGEQRWQLIGMASSVALLVVIHTCRDDDDDELVRIISARKAERQERRLYEDGFQATSGDATDSQAASHVAQTGRDA